MKEEEEAEAKAMADADAGEDSEEEGGLAGKLIGHLEGLFDMPALAPHKKHVQPLFDLLEQHENLIFGIIAAPLLLLLASFGLLGGSKVRQLRRLTPPVLLLHGVAGVLSERPARVLLPVQWDSQERRLEHASKTVEPHRDVVPSGILVDRSTSK